MQSYYWHNVWVTRRVGCWDKNFGFYIQWGSVACLINVPIGTYLFSLMFTLTFLWQTDHTVLFHRNFHCVMIFQLHIFYDKSKILKKTVKCEVLIQTFKINSTLSEKYILLNSCWYVGISLTILVNLQIAMKRYMVVMVMTQKTETQHLLLLTILLLKTHTSPKKTTIG